MRIFVSISLVALSVAVFLLGDFLIRHDIKRAWEQEQKQQNKRDLFVKLDAGAFMPTRAHSTDAGLDLKTPKSFYLRPHDTAVIDTGVHIQLPSGTAGLMVAKSGLNIHSDILSTGLIDEGYTGSIRVKLYNHSAEPYQFIAGDKISQLVIIPVVYGKTNIVDSFPSTERGNNGFGSSGR